mgnify:CR=1 FL=1
MRKIIFALTLALAAINIASAQKIVSFTKTISKFGNCKIEETEFTDGKLEYSVFLSSADLKNVGTRLIDTNRESLYLRFNSKDEMVRCLQFLYNFQKGDGYFIDLENKSHNTVTTFDSNFLFHSPKDIDSPLIGRHVFGKLLNGLKISAKSDEEKAKERKRNDEDMYFQSDGVF